MGLEEGAGMLLAGGALTSAGRGTRGPLRPTPASLHQGPALTAHCLLSGSLEERGFLAWTQLQESEESTKALKIYSLPCGIGTKSCTSSRVRYLPFWPRLQPGGKGAAGVSQLTLCSQDSSGEHQKGATETRM